ncbi:MAG: hypothetical protein HY080_17060 [Gammaproteobacteria bacterium]|nr:hypothetical protein [Gammaproteobacteria bacterium]
MKTAKSSVSIMSGPRQVSAAWLLIGLMLLVAMLLAPLHAHAAAKTKKFDHDTTGFILTGAHVDLVCDSCHIRGIFKGIPKTCDGCHAQVSQITATKKSSNHIRSSDRCDDCHVDTAFKPARVDHSSVIGTCISCHDGRVATGKPVNHPPAGNNCESCHRTTTWATSGFNHEGITNNCGSCHNGVNAKSKMPTDIVHSNVMNVTSCENCHTSFTTWPPAIFDHSYISVTTCVTCHKPGTVVKTTRPAMTSSGAAHVAQDNCESCHNTASWKLTGAFNHSGITGNCVSCHSALKPADVVHANVSNVTVCENCHTSFSVWPPTSFNHAFIASNQCVKCHTPGAMPKHTSRPVTTSSGATHPVDDNCQNCHVNTSSWTIGSFDHNGITNNCVSCHMSKKPTDTEHSNFTSPTVCENCHKSFTTWPLTTLDHSLNATSHCVTCHSPGHKTVTVRPALKANGLPHDVNDNCELCHNPGTSWTTGAGGKPADHNTRTSGCSSCHLTLKTTAHIPSPDTCESCHRPDQAAWKPSTWTHTSAVTSSYTCYKCHDGTHSPPADGMSGKHIKLIGTSGCNLCHTTAAWSPTTKVDHTQVSGTCVSCHKPNNPPVKTSKASDSSGHIASSDNCDACHTSTSTWTVHRVSHSEVSTTCTGCHSQSPTGSTNPHGPTPGVIHFNTAGANCGNSGCHNTSSWTVATYTHSAGDTNCNACHASNFTGIMTTSADPGHLTGITLMQCDSCHHSKNPGGFAQKVTYTHNVALAKDHDTSVACRTCHKSSVPQVTYGLYPECPDHTMCAACHKSTPKKYNPNDPNSHGGVPACSQDCGQCHGIKSRGF